jgi:hypothetical protein
MVEIPVRTDYQEETIGNMGEPPPKARYPIISINHIVWGITQRIQA